MLTAAASPSSRPPTASALPSRILCREPHRIHPRDEPAEVLALAQDLGADGAALLGGETFRVHPLRLRSARGARRCDVR